PRKFFEASSLDELAQSIREQGILQPLIVRRVGEGYELIAGERRLRAGKLAGLKEVPAVIRKADDRTVLELMLVENLQREDLNPIDEARGFEQLIREFGLTQESAAARVGKGRVVVANALRLLKLPQSVQLMVADGRLSVGHAKAILSLELFEDMQVLAERVIAGKLSVRETEALVARKLSRDDLAEKKQVLPLNVHLKKIEEKLREAFGTQVKVKSADGDRGSLEIQFYSKEDLNRLLDLFSIRID
ncbi:MAG TPA: ParB/RepB/Spo0J family partition protein, partial [Verrucomicrobiota bacterium]|nr:ParB/RepB/Spo0J family partition protein [Verrucomicrobiota bacterium]